MKLRQPPPPKRTLTATSPLASGPSRKDSEALIAQVKPIFGVLPALATRGASPVTEAQIKLGRQLYFEKRLSRNHDISCNSCHSLTNYGIDVREPRGATSSGHRGALGDRNSPTVYNAALHISQFWDGRAADVEEQAKGPILNPVEMAIPAESDVTSILTSIPGYASLFAAAFPNDDDPVTYDNVALAIGAFERKLLTPAPFDAFLAGDTGALDAEEQRGLSLFVEVGCTACHAGPTVGGQMYQKLGLIKLFPTEDVGRAKVTGNAAETHFFKVPSLRNVAKTAPYLHDGSVATLEEMVKLMAKHQTTRGDLTDTEVSSIVAFLNSLTGKLPPKTYIGEPETLPSGPDTPGPVAD